MYQISFRFAGYGLGRGQDDFLIGIAEVSLLRRPMNRRSLIASHHTTLIVLTHTELSKPPLLPDQLDIDRHYAYCIIEQGSDNILQRSKSHAGNL